MVLGPKIIQQHRWRENIYTTVVMVAGAVGYAVRASERLLVMPEVNIGTTVSRSNCGGDCTGGLLVQAALGFHFDR